MNYSNYRFTLDLRKHQSQMSIAVFKYDTAVRLCIGITDGGKSYFIEDGCTAYFFGNRADGEPLIHPCMIRDNTEIIYEFKESTAYVDGIVECQIRLYGKDKQLISAPKFIITVDERVASDAINYIDDDKLDAVDAMLQAEIERSNAETLRDIAENGEKDEEGNVITPGRVQAEAERVSNEAERVSNEEARKLAEDHRNEVLDSFDALLTESLSNFDKTISNQSERIEANNAISNKLDIRVTNIERHINQDYFLTDDSIAYRKLVPLNACPYAGISKIGGMTKKCNNLYNGLQDVPLTGYAMTKKIFEGNITEDVTLSYTVNGTEPTNMAAFIQITQADDTVINTWFVEPAEKTKTQSVKGCKKIVVANWCNIEGTLSNIMLNYGNTALPYEPYFEGLKHSKVTEIVSRGKNLLPSDVFDVNSWEQYTDAWYKYNLDLPDGWYCASVELKDNPQMYFYLTKSTDGGTTYSSADSVYTGDGRINNGYFITGVGVENAPCWFKVDKNAGILCRFATSATSKNKLQSNLNQIKYIQIEKVDLAQEPSTSYKPSVYAPASEYVPYNPNPIDTFTLPEALIEFLKPHGLGKGIDGTRYNYIDLDRGVFVKKVGSLDLGSLNYRVDTIENIETGLYSFASDDIPNLKSPEGKTTDGVLCAKYLVEREGFIHDDTWYTPPHILILTSEYGDDTDALKQAVAGTELVYELETPEEIYISQYLTKDAFIEVQERGYIVPENEHKNPAPTSITYLLKEV